MLFRSMGRLRPGVIAERTVRSRERLDGLAQRSSQATVAGLMQRRRALDSQTQMLSSLSYQSVLRRGFALVRDDAGKAVRSATGILTGAVLEIEWADGRVATQATGSSAVPSKSSPPGETRSPTPTRSPARARRPAKPSARQPSLFDE